MDELHNRHYLRLKNYGLQFCTCELRIDAAINHATYKLWRKLVSRSFKAETPSCVIAYLSTIVRNELTSHYRKAKAAKQRHEAYWTHVAGLSPDQDVQEALDDAIDGFDVSSYVRDLRTALSQLPEEDVTLILAFHLEGKSAKELSAELGAALGTVYKHLRRALKRLRARFKQLQEEHEGQV